MRIPFLPWSVSLSRRDGASTLKDPDDRLRLALNGAPVLSGMAVNEGTAMGVSAVYACVRVLAETLAQLPLRIMRGTTTGSEVVTEHPLYRLLKAEPNEWQTSFEFREMLQGHVALRGNAYAYIKRNGENAPVAFIPLDPTKIKILRLPNEQGVVYQYGERFFARWEVLHIRGLTSDGFTGLSPIALLRETIGLPMALEKTTAALLGNGVRPSGTLEHPAELSDEAAMRLKAQFQAASGGVANTGKAIVLEEGMKWNQTGMTFEDAQILQNKRFSVEEIARVYRIPLHMIQSTDKSTSWGTGIEQMTLGFVQFSMQPWLVRWEQTLDAVCLTEAEKAQNYFIKFDLRGLLRGDHKSRMEAYAIGLLNGIYSINEVREFEDMNELPDAIGGVHRVPLNTEPSGSKPAKEKQTTPTNEDDDDET